MKEKIEQIGIETVFAGLFGFIAIIAVFFEMVIAGFDAASIAGGIKDIAGTIITVVMLIIAVRALTPKKKTTGGFAEIFDREMDKVLAKYYPLIQKDGAIQGRYNIADNMSVLIKNIDCKYHRMFDFDYKRELTFIVSKTLFMGKSKEDFSELQTIITNAITSKIIAEYDDVLNEKYKPVPDGFRLTFKQSLLTSEDAANVVKVIDKIILLYIVEYKK